MELPIKIISTDFDGTLFAEFENPPVPARLIEVLGELQARGAKWVINTGRDMSALMETLARGHLPLQPDFLVLVEREIYAHQHSKYIPVEPWNTACARDHTALFKRLEPDLTGLFEWIDQDFEATVYRDSFSPFCLIARNHADADAINQRLETYCRGVPDLALVRNDVYARFSHASYHKGSALAEIARGLGVAPSHIFAVGDHLNDLPMLSTKYAAHLAAPANAVPQVKAAVRRQGGHVSALPHGHGVAEALEALLVPRGD